jgi:hypothetical protein
MAVGNVLLAAPLPGDPDVLDLSAAAAECSLAGVPVVAPHVPTEPSRTADDLSDAAVRQWLATTAMALRRASPAGATLLVLQGAAALRAPDLALALQGSRRARAGYVLVGPTGLPPPGLSQWPDAPVVVIPGTDPAPAADARRRGWQVLQGYAPTLVAQVAARP